MSEPTKILVAYDGLEHSENVINELKFAGLPNENVELFLMQVAEIWLPPTNVAVNTEPHNFIEEQANKRIERNQKILSDIAVSVSEAGKKIAEDFPQWIVKAKATFGSSAWEILSRADDFKPDLIIVGSHGRSMLHRFLLGSVSQKIVTEANCSVRVARHKNKSFDAPSKIVLAYDGTKGADEAVRILANRHWKANSEVLVVMVEDLTIIQQAFDFERKVFETLGESVVKKLEAAGLKSDLVILEGSPKQEIVEQAANFGADCIFVGATKFDNKLERFLLGSVSSAIASRASCSVEIVRPNYYKSN